MFTGRESAVTLRTFSTSCACAELFPLDGFLLLHVNTTTCFNNRRVFFVSSTMEVASKTGKRPMVPKTAQEKLNAIQRVHSGESKASVARHIGVPESTLRGWCKNEEKIARQSSSPESDRAPPREKRMKLSNVQDLSMKPRLYSPNSEISKKPQAEQLNLIKNELGLNGPEVFTAASNNSSDILQATLKIMQYITWCKHRGISVTGASTLTTSSTTTTSSTNGHLANQLYMQPLSWETYQAAMTYLNSPAWTATSSTSTAAINSSAPSTSTTSSYSQPSTSTGISNNTVPCSSTDLSLLPASTSSNSATSTKANKNKWYNILTSANYGAAENKILFNELTRGEPQQQNDDEQPIELTKKTDFVNSHAKTNGHGEEKIHVEEGVQHGEKFLEWLESVEHPRVTRSFIMQVRSFLTNFKENGTSSSSTATSDVQNGTENGKKRRKCYQN